MKKVALIILLIIALASSFTIGYFSGLSSKFYNDNDKQLLTSYVDAVYSFALIKQLDNDSISEANALLNYKLDGNIMSIHAILSEFSNDSIYARSRKLFSEIYQYRKTSSYTRPRSISDSSFVEIDAYVSGVLEAASQEK